MDDVAAGAMGIVAGVLFLVFIFVAGISVGANAMRQEVLKRGFAEYNQQTGAWQWKDTDTEKAGE
jgi:hypothetical protein